MHIDGSCHCGHIRYEAEVDPDKVSVCHCTDCQTLSGTAFRVVVPAPKEGFRLLAGQPKIYLKTAESGNKRAQAFCAECGSHLYAHAAVEKPERLGLRVGCLQERAALVPSKRIWCKSALAWSQNLQGLQELERE